MLQDCLTTGKPDYSELAADHERLSEALAAYDAALAFAALTPRAS